MEDTQTATDLVDQVNNPDYYNKTGIETIDLIKNSMSEVEFRGYLKGNIIKYVSRHMHKGMPLKDVLKAQWYIDRLADQMEYHGVEENGTKY
jgi:hypothetical protein|tara:strand:+ start:618 stop:893 length:276 start_codon:yes stop_codon:yes gene_type:complete